MGDTFYGLPPASNESSSENKLLAGEIKIIEKNIERIDKTVEGVNKDVQKREAFLDQLRIWVLVVIAVVSTIGTWAGITLSTVRTELSKTVEDVATIGESVATLRDSTVKDLSTRVGDLSDQLDVAKASLTEVLNQRDQLIHQMEVSAETAQSNSIDAINRRQQEVQSSLRDSLDEANKQLGEATARSIGSLTERFNEFVESEVGVTVLASTKNPQSFVRSRPDNFVRSADVTVTRVDTFTLPRSGIAFASMQASAQYTLADLFVRSRVGLTGFIEIDGKQCGADSSIIPGKGGGWSTSIVIFTSPSCAGVPLSQGEHTIKTGVLYLVPAQGTRTFPLPVEEGFDEDWIIVADTAQVP